MPSGASTSRVAESWPEARNSRQRRSCHDRTGVSSTARTISPSKSPAAAAGEASGGGASTARCPGMPARYVPVNRSTASTRLASGPAATMAARFHTLCRLKARGRSAGATSPSRSSTILT